MKGYPCKNADRGCTANVLKSKDDGKYHEIDENGNIGARHFCKFWPKKEDGKTPQDVLNQQKEIMSEYKKIGTAVDNTTEVVSLVDLKHDINIFYIEHQKNMADIKRIMSEFGEAIAKMSFEKASKLK